MSIGDFLKESECLYEEERKASCASRIAVVGQAMMTAGTDTDEKNKDQGSEKIADAVMSNGAANGNKMKGTENNVRIMKPFT